MVRRDDIRRVRANIGRRIHDLREERGWSQYKFAEIVPIDRTYLIGIEKGRRNPTVDNLIKISLGLGVPLSDLFVGVEYDSSADGQKAEEPR